MSKIFTRTFRTRWSEINANGHVDIPGFLRYLVETAWDWGAVNGLSIAKNDELGLAWVIRETEINFFNSLHPNDVFDFTIWLVKWRRIRGTRCFEVRLTDGSDLIAQGVQQVVTLDQHSLHPTPPPAQLIERFIIENPRSIQHQRFPKVTTQPNSVSVIQRRVEWHDLDSLDHVNNATYAAYAQEAATQAMAEVGWSPSELRIRGLAVFFRRFHIQYQSPAYWGDVLNMSTSLLDLKRSGGLWYTRIIRGHSGEEIVKCILKWSLVDPISAEEQPLPESLYLALKNIS